MAENEELQQGQQDAQAETESADASAIDWEAKYKAMREHARTWEDRANKNKKAAEKLEQLEKAKDEDEKSLQRQIDELKATNAENSRKLAVAHAAQEYGVDADLLARMQGGTEEEIDASAKALKAALDARPKYPTIPDKGESKAPSMSRTDIAAIEDDKQRLAAIQANINAYE